MKVGTWLSAKECQVDSRIRKFIVTLESQSDTSGSWVYYEKAISRLSIPNTLFSATRIASPTRSSFPPLLEK